MKHPFANVLGGCPAEHRAALSNAADCLRNAAPLFCPPPALLQEIDALLDLDHPNVVGLKEYFVQNNRVRGHHLMGPRHAAVRHGQGESEGLLWCWHVAHVYWRVSSFGHVAPPFHKQTNGNEL